MASNYNTFEGSFTAAIIGATGSVGRDLVERLNSLDKCTQIILVVRSMLDEWTQVKYKNKIKIIKCTEMDDMEKFTPKLIGYDIFYWCLGSNTAKGEEEFLKVDFQYPIYFANIAKNSKAIAYFLISSESASLDSWYLYSRTKARVEQELRDIGLQNLIILRPGTLLNKQKGWSFGDYLAKLSWCFSSVSIFEVSKWMIYRTLLLIKWSSEWNETPNILNNTQIIKDSKQL